MSLSLHPSELDEGDVAICGIRFQDEAATSDVQATLRRLADDLPHLVRQAVDGTWWVGTTVLFDPRQGLHAPWPEQAERMRHIVDGLPAELRDHPAAWPFGVWAVRMHE